MCNEETEIQIQLLNDQANGLGESYRSTLHAYITWYSFFITLNLIALPFAASGKDFKDIIVIVFLVIDCIACASCTMVLSYFRKTTSKIEELRRSIWTISLSHDSENFLEKNFVEVTPSKLAIYAAAANLAGLVFIWIIWIWLLLSRITH